MLSRKAKRQAPPDNPETGDTYEYHSKDEAVLARNGSLGHLNVHRRRSSSSASIYIRVYTGEADFHRPVIY